MSSEKAKKHARRKTRKVYKKRAHDRRHCLSVKPHYGFVSIVEATSIETSYSHTRVFTSVLIALSLMFLLLFVYVITASAYSLDLGKEVKLETEQSVQYVDQSIRGTVRHQQLANVQKGELLPKVVSMQYIQNEQQFEEQYIQNEQQLENMKQTNVVQELETAQFSETALEEDIEPDVKQELTAETVKYQSFSTSKNVAFLHWNSIFDWSQFMSLSNEEQQKIAFSRDWVPSLEKQQISPDDIMIDLDEAMAPNPQKAYSPSEEIEFLLALIVEGEGGNQPFEGQVAVAEGPRNRYLSGVYGDDMLAILNNGGYVKFEKVDGQWCVYSAGRVITEPSESAKRAVKVALAGSDFTGYLLRVITEQWQEKGWDMLDAKYYEHGNMYHYNPNYVSDKQLMYRSLARTPVSVKIYDQIFYGYWHPESQPVF